MKRRSEWARRSPGRPPMAAVRRPLGRGTLARVAERFGTMAGIIKFFGGLGIVAGAILGLAAANMLFSDQPGSALTLFALAAAALLQGALLAGFGMLIELTEGIARNIAVIAGTDAAKVAPVITQRHTARARRGQGDKLQGPPSATDGGRNSPCRDADWLEAVQIAPASRRLHPIARLGEVEGALRQECRSKPYE